jgi:dual specificity phosphatase 12
MLIACEKHPIFDKITDNIYLGDIVAAGNISLLKKYNINVVISCIFEKYERDIEISYYDFPIEDNRNEDIYSIFVKTNEIISKNRDKNILIHCQNAVSRSVTILLAYLLFTGINLKDGIEKIRRIRKTFTRPNIGFSRSLLKYESELFGKNSITLDKILKY